ncbi:glycosyltransferase family 4 protein [Phycicoccus sp.]|uniref:glycosyltransferase family 4 protein n=1 Tax=Phycicoccus sp. TaxID=1902410 RepID=UPI002CCD68AC|nr:glycosyltransferase family 4 protein [Phycicoccus sp.]HMM93623.1 glycosyltransferase family 4 protein [Phycicoccus sp.]
MTLKVLMVTQWFDPEGGSAAQAGVIARSLKRHGAHVEVLTGFPNYPSGQVADGYRIRPYLRETLDGITVHRAPLWPSHDSAATRRMLNYLSWAAGAGVVGALRAPPADAVLVHSTPGTAGLPALALKATRRLPFVVHVQDLWPQTVLASDFLASGRARRLERPLHLMCDTIYRHASAIAVTSPSMAPRVAERGVPSDKIRVAANWADESIFRPVARDEDLAQRLGLTRPFTFMYAGNLGPYQGLDTLLDAAALLRDRTDIGIAVVGGGVREQALRNRARTMGLQAVQFVGPVPFAEMTPVLALGDAHLVSLQDLPLFRMTLPSKLQATLAAGRPLVGAVTGDAALVVRESGAGPVVTPGDAPALAGAIRNLADLSREALADRGRRARAHYVDNFSEDVSSRVLLELLEQAAGTRARAAA